MKVNTPFRISVLTIALHTAFSPSVRAVSEDATVKRTPMESSTIASAGYISGEGILEIEFRSGAVYRYKRVPKKIFIAFAKAQSKGRFFGSEIRGKYSFERRSGASK